MISKRIPRKMITKSRINAGKTDLIAVNRLCETRLKIIAKKKEAKPIKKAFLTALWGIFFPEPMLFHPSKVSNEW